MRKILLTEKEIYSGYLILVNAEHPYHEEASHITLSPLDLEMTDILLERAKGREDKENTRMEKHALGQFLGLMEEIGGWEKIIPVSGWRSLKEQQDIFDDTLRESGEEFTRKFVALPGCSEHQTGLAIDLAFKKESVDFICPDFPNEGICQKFRERAAAFGFIERYQAEKEQITGISREPWHFRYVGCPHAEIMNSLGMCLEEYISYIKQYPFNNACYEYKTDQREAEIYYLAAGNGVDCVEIEDHIRYSISGNNVDGYIVTEWKG